MGTLEEWQQNVGKYCQGNSLLVLAVSSALTGTVLRPCGLEGGGLHIYGASSSGKSTTAYVAGSVCGGGSNKGFIRQWNTTHNALEAIAVLHNDNLLVLDEIGQAAADTIAQMPYMLANGQGKGRLRADATARKTKRWLINFLSTGEQTIGDKIQETGKNSVHVGQLIRVIDLPIDAGTGSDLYSDLHGFSDGASLSDALVSNSKQFYGTPIRAFLASLCGSSQDELNQNIELIKANLEEFVMNTCPQEASGQVRRVCQKFGLIAAVGELAVSAGIFPFQPGEPYEAAKNWFKIWLQERQTIGNLEISNVLRRFQGHFATHFHEYIDNDSRDNFYPRPISGYTWTDRTGQQCFLVLAPKFTELLKGANRNTILEAMRKHGWLECTSSGEVQSTKSINGKNERGYTFYIQRVKNTNIG